MYISGIITGLVIAIVCMLSIRRYETPIQRTVKNLENMTKEKGAVFVEDENVEDLRAFINNLPTE